MTQEVLINPSPMHLYVATIKPERYTGLDDPKSQKEVKTTNLFWLFILESCFFLKSNSEAPTTWIIPLETLNLSP